MSDLKVTCPYCSCAAELVDSGLVYKRSYGYIWICRPCGAWVGVHKNSRKHAPLGTLANAELRRARGMAHEAFDPLWKRAVEGGEPKSTARSALYARLADELGIDKEQCHIAMFDLRTCVSVIEICGRWRRKEEARAGANPLS